jgi:serine/threonine protein phosphatase PrpC
LDGTRLIPESHSDRTGFGICRCGAGPDAIDETGFCTECGIRRDIRLRDHVEMQIADNFAGVTDRGVRHNENQDDMALAVVQTGQDAVYIAVVCDGVSGSEGAANASSTAAKTACAALERGIERVAGQDLSHVAAEPLMLSAIAEANTAVCHLTYNQATAKDPPETTIVAAVVLGQTAVIGWMGDSRAYWITDTDSAILTRDHSWVNDIVDSGQMTEAEALKSPMAHAIVRCLGGPTISEQPLEPSVVTCTLPDDARLLLCSDGLWNYASTLDALSDLVRRIPGESPRGTAQRLVQYAVEKGGKDNITAAILALEPR